jgi:hypothetical protein
MVGKRSSISFRAIRIHDFAQTIASYEDMLIYDESIPSILNIACWCTSKSTQLSGITATCTRSQSPSEIEDLIIVFKSIIPHLHNHTNEHINPVNSCSNNKQYFWLILMPEALENLGIMACCIKHI